MPPKGQAKEKKSLSPGDMPIFAKFCGFARNKFGICRFLICHEAYVNDRLDPII